MEVLTSLGYGVLPVLAATIVPFFLGMPVEMFFCRKMKSTFSVVDAWAFGALQILGLTFIFIVGTIVRSLLRGGE